jgi:hypothetical protein
MLNTLCRNDIQLCVSTLYIYIYIEGSDYILNQCDIRNIAVNLDLA